MPGAAPLRIAWFGSAPNESGSAGGVVTELLDGLATLGHTIDCFLPGTPRKLPDRVEAHENINVVWGNNPWRWNSWYNRNEVMIFTSGLLFRALTSMRMRGEVVRRHRERPYDVLFQLSSIESLSAPRSMRDVPLVIRPDSHQAGELRWQLKERRLALRCQPAYVYLFATAVMMARTLVQLVRIRRAALVIALSSVFRDHIVRDYRFPAARTAVVTNPVRLDTFGAAALDRGVAERPLVLVPGRVSVRKGIEDIAPLAQALERRGVDVRIRVVGGPSLWSDYRPLLQELPANAEYAEHVEAQQMPAEFAAADVVLQPSRYDPCPMTVIEALAGGVPVVATSEVGSIEGVDRGAVIEVPPGDVEAMANGVCAMLERLRADAPAVRRLASAEAHRRFAPEVVCAQISAELERVAAGPGAPGRPSSNGAGPAADSTAALA